MAFYNFKRTHQGHRVAGRTPLRLSPIHRCSAPAPLIPIAVEEVPLASGSETVWWEQQHLWLMPRNPK
jgi:hypothetical protein